MIRVDFDGKTNIPGSLLLTAEDLIDATGLVEVLRDSTAGLSRYLREQCSPSTQQLIAQHVTGTALTQEFRDALLDDLNKQLQGPSLFEARRLRGVDFPRDTLIKGLIKQGPKPANVAGFNRLLLEDVYPAHIAKSPKVEWDAWLSLAEDATARVIEQWENWKVVLEKWQQQQPRVGDPPEFKAAWEEYIWKGIRLWLAEYIFYHKCAYCETFEVGHIDDAEHFRPKGQVRTKSGIVKTFHVDGTTEIIHPGYFWLAYRWENLLPSCNTCNRYNGKKDAFPVGKDHVAVRLITDPTELKKLRRQQRKSQNINGVFYLEPEDLDQIEDRLLLHPYFDRPAKHVYFQADGRAAPLTGSKQGQASIDVYDLNERGKVTRRSQTQEIDALAYMTRITAAAPKPDRMKSAAEEIAEEYFRGTRPYAAAVFDQIRIYTGNGAFSPDVLLKDTPYFKEIDRS